MINMIHSLDKKVIDLILKFERISFYISFIGIITLYIFFKFYIDISLYHISIIIFRTGILAGISSFCFGTFFNGLNKGLIHK